MGKSVVRGLFLGGLQGKPRGKPTIFFWGGPLKYDTPMSESVGPCFLLHGNTNQPKALALTHSPKAFVSTCGTHLARFITQPWSPCYRIEASAFPIGRFSRHVKHQDGSRCVRSKRGRGPTSHHSPSGQAGSQFSALSLNITSKPTAYHRHGRLSEFPGNIQAIYHVGEIRVLPPWNVGLESRLQHFSASLFRNSLGRQ